MTPCDQVERQTRTQITRRCKTTVANAVEMVALLLVMTTWMARRTVVVVGSRAVRRTSLLKWHWTDLCLYWLLLRLIKVLWPAGCIQWLGCIIFLFFVDSRTAFVEIPFSLANPQTAAAATASGSGATSLSSLSSVSSSFCCSVLHFFWLVIPPGLQLIPSHSSSRWATATTPPPTTWRCRTKEHSSKSPLQFDWWPSRWKPITSFIVWRRRC